MGAIRTAVVVMATALAGTPARAQDVTIVVNRNLSSSAITETQLRDIFTGARSRFDDGRQAAPVLLKGGPVHEVFLRRHIGDTPDEFRARWRKAVFTGQGAMPKEFSSEAELLHYVESTPGAIGYVSHVSGREAVKLLTITGGH
jgi:ABC-type phosphate transport system substrate-binding protein